MKIRTTKKEIMKGYKNIIVASYCDLAELLRFKEANFNTVGVYGWNADIYQIDNNTAICTGYRPFGNIENYDLNKKYNNQARKILYNANLSYKQREQKIDKLIEKFVKEIIGE